MYGNRRYCDASIANLSDISDVIIFHRWNCWSVEVAHQEGEIRVYWGQRVLVDLLVVVQYLAVCWG